MTTDPNTLLTAPHVKIDDRLAGRTRIGRPPKPADAELVTLAVAQALLGFTPTAAIWHNRATDQVITRSLTAYDH
ncbi:hypothetical protein KCV87_09845 [Actinosynnema pretiosum subsp. pretiosum]|uniref:Transposase n=1 Tax=Actinosynnema pretiosum subsp. pretiosum TaxID=103721 RepID=A0AA45L9W0_9PSEU|nr:putative transposase [Actinosynnema pretiosum subsp. pretiosum]QUF06324.1 hypothetical protein KCV87_09845 [Actinosynnema pretiosum subsp. pretiosum]